MKKLFIFFTIYHLSLNIIAQSISLDPNTLQLPQLSVNPSCTISDKGKMIYNTTQEKIMYCNGTDWIDPTSGGIPNNWVNSGNNSYLSNLNGMVGIGTNNPASPLSIVYSGDYAGLNLKSTVGYSLMGIDSKNGLAALKFSNNEVGKWYLGNNVDNNFHIYKMDGNYGPKFIINSYGVGIGVSDPNNTLDVNGRVRVRNNGSTSGIWTSSSTNSLNSADGAFWGLKNDNTAGIYIGDNWRMELTNAGDMSIDGSLTVNNGKGVAYNPTGATNLKIYPFTTANFSAVLAGFAMSPETGIVFGGNFTTAPKVIVGDIDYTLGSLGELYRVQLVVYGCKVDNANNSSCKARLINTSPNPVNYNIIWNCIAIGN